MRFGFGVDVGGTTVKIACFSEAGEILGKWEIPTVIAHGGKAILPDIAASIQNYMKTQGLRREDFIGVGVGVPGPTDDNGVVNGCHNLNWGVVDVKKLLAELLDCPVCVGNDANMAALGELWKGGGKGYRNMVLVTLGTGVGGGIILNGRPLNGAHGSAGEIGHIVINPHEKEPCNCGNYGCAEQYCSATGVVRMAKRFLESHDTDSVLRGAEDFTCKTVFDAAEAGDEAAKEILDQVYRYMGIFISSVCNTVDPEVVVIGGGVSRAGQPLLEGIRKYFSRHAFHPVKNTGFAIAILGNDAGAYGAFKLALDGTKLT